MRRKKQFTNYVKFNLQYNKRQSLLSDSSNLRKLVKSVVLDGKLFHKLTTRLLKEVNSSIIRTTLFIHDIFVTAQVWLIS